MAMNSLTQIWQPDRYSERTGFVADGGLPVIELLAPQPGERILDLGCGTGTLTRTLADAKADVLGLDASAEMVEAARAAHPELRFEVGDGEALEFDAEFDGVFSNAALHWMRRADLVALGMYRALRPGGRLAAELGGYGNVAAVRAAVERAASELALSEFPQPFAPWYFPRLGEYAALLESAGFTVRRAWWFERPSPMPDRGAEAGISAWLEIFAGRWLGRLSSETRARFLAKVVEHARAALYRDGTWWIDYVRLRVEAVK
jgi:trans-aconitate methyltransferase